jgi:hypothetical protein
MKNTTKLLFTIVLLMAISNVQAQSHTFATGWCKLAKSGGVKGESASLECQACNAKDKKEREAKVAENNRRDAIIVAKAKAEKEAYENARLEKIRLAEAEAKRIKNQEIADKIASDAMLKKYKEVAEKGMIKSNVKGTTTTSDLSLDGVIPFSDNTRKIYGFKIDGIEVLTFPFEGIEAFFKRLDKTNFFIVNNYSERNKYGSTIFTNFSLVNHLGVKMKIDGFQNFNNLAYDQNIIYIVKRTGDPEIITKNKCYNVESDAFTNGGLNGSVNIYSNRESALAAIETLAVTRSGLAMCYNYKICIANQYKVDESGKLIEKSSGYVLIPYRD